MKHTEFPPAAEQPGDKLDHGECVANSLDIAMEDPDLRYAEGIAKGYLGVWYRHAWNVNGAGEAVDHTWEHTGSRYIGRIIDADEKWAAVERRDAYHFDADNLPYVPDGEMGLDCYTREQADWIRNQYARRH